MTKAQKDATFCSYNCQYDMTNLLFINHLSSGVLVSIFFSSALITISTGNLPLSATAEDVTQHFHKQGVPVLAVRMLSDKQSGKSRGCCFVDLANDKCQQVCAYIMYSFIEKGIYSIFNQSVTAMSL